MVKRLCRDGDGVAVVAGRAGTGKTFALGAAREAWQAAGHPVLGVAVARRAAAELRDGAGIQSTSTFALLADLRGGVGRLPRGCVLVVDEAGMVPTRELAELAEHVEAVEGKLVLVGDHRQLPSSRPAACSARSSPRGLAIELTENVRQVHAWERRALDQLRDGRARAGTGRLRRARPADRRRDRRCGARAARRRLVGRRRPRRGGDDRPAASRRRRPQRARPGAACARRERSGPSSRRPPARSRSATSSWSSATTAAAASTTATAAA